MASMHTPRALVAAAGLVHGALAVCVLGLVLTTTRSLLAGLSLAVMLLAPLALTAPGLLAGRRYVLQILLILLVAYIGGGIVEVIAARGGWLAALGFALACLEFGLVLTIARRPIPRARRESTESSSGAV
jgi:uncharacterized membrane protein